MKAIERVPVVQQVADSLREHILSGKAKPGDKLPTEMALCESLGVGRGTVREALRMLQAGGLVEVQPGRGAFVARATEGGREDIVRWLAENEVELKDCFEVRGAIEPLAIRLAIQHADEGAIAEIARAHEEFLAAVQVGSPAEIARCDERFHGLIIEKSGNRMLVAINQMMGEYTSSFRGRTFQFQQNVLNAVEPHSNIMRALLERDADAGELFMRRHIQRIIEDYNSNIGQ